MLTRLILLLAASVLLIPTNLHAQARPTATRLGELQIGGGVISANSDYDHRVKGFFGYADFDVTRHLGGEFELHQLASSDGEDVRERTYEVGARYRLTHVRFIPYVKVMVGRGVFNFPYNQANLAYNLYALGGGLDLRLLRRVNLRGDYEYQNWLSFQSGSLKPTLISIGAAYRF